MRIVGDAVAASNYGAVGHLVGKAEARGKQLLAETDAVVLRDAAAPANQRLVGVRVVRLDAEAARAPPVRIELPAQAEVKRQVRPHAPPVTGVECVLVLHAVHLDELAALPGPRRRPEQEPRQRVPVVLERRRVALESDAAFECVRIERGDAGIESESATWPGA